MSEDGLVLIVLAYLALLFGVAWWAERRAAAGRSVAANPYIYTLSIAVYCTAWTFYGSVGRAASNGVSFLPIYLGPTLTIALGWLVLRKIVRVAKRQHITSIADFIGSRYGKSALLSGIVTVIAVIGILPYISLQLKAVAISFQVLSGTQTVGADAIQSPLWRDTALWIALLMAAFTILFGTRSIDASERHEGMVAAIAFESLVKLIAFLAVGVFVTFALFDGPGEIFSRIAERQDLAQLLSLNGVPGGAGGWLMLLLVSMCAIICLPRQFHVAVVENVDESHLKRAAWLFPGYLLVINLFVLPIAFGGLLIFGNGVEPDTFVLTLPLNEGAGGLALLVFLGGLSAATGMVIVETIALATMVCNELVLPVLLRLRVLGLGAQRQLASVLLTVRRATIVVVLLLGYAYFRLIGESYTLVTIGLVSFVAAAQFAPAILAGIYWRGASRRGALTGLLAGFAVWSYTLLLPGFARSGWLPDAFVASGAFGISILKPYALFGLTGLDPISHAAFWSLLFNAGGLVMVSLFTRQSALERVQAAAFVEPYRQDPGTTGYWAGTATVTELRTLLARFLGEAQADRVLDEYGAKHRLSTRGEAEADPLLVEQVEHILAGAIGSASARVMVASTVRGEAPSIEKVMSIVDETSKVMEYSRRLEEKSQELEAASRELREANERLEELDRLKDEFVATVSHELRTPLTSIRAFSEILQQDPDLEAEQRQEFLDIIVKETERLTRLINEVLDLAKIEAGSMEWRSEKVDLRDPVRSAASSMSQLYSDSEIALDLAIPDKPVWVRGDPDRLTQVLMNLLSNAEKFCAPKRGRVELKLDLCDGQVRLQVADNGPGIPRDQIGRLFEKFQQLDGASAGKRAGTGLGLAISQRIVVHHGGRIHVESERGQGTAFIIELPASEGSSKAASENSPRA